jgi:hypothetical protein
LTSCANMKPGTSENGERAGSALRIHFKVHHFYTNTAERRTLA